MSNDDIPVCVCYETGDFQNFHSVNIFTVQCTADLQETIKMREGKRREQAVTQTDTYRVFDMGRWKVGRTYIHTTVDIISLPPGGKVVFSLSEGVHLEEEMGAKLV